MELNNKTMFAIGIIIIIIAITLSIINLPCDGDMAIEYILGYRNTCF